MKSFATVIVLLSLLSVTPVSGEVVEVPIPEFLGEYAGGSPVRRVTLEFENPPAAVHGVWFRVAGVTEVGELCCDDGCVPWPTEVLASMKDDEQRWWSVDELLHTPGAFELLGAFQTIPARPPSWDFLLDGVVEINFGAWLAIYPLGCGPTHPLPTVWIEEAVFIIDAEFPVQARTSTWGRLKELYR